MQKTKNKSYVDPKLKKQHQTRRVFIRNNLKTAAALSVLPAFAAQTVKASAPPASYARISGVKVIRVRKKNGNGRVFPFVEILTDAGVSGYGGSMYDEQARVLEKYIPVLEKWLIGNDPRASELGFLWLWNHLFPDNSLTAYADMRDPLTTESIRNTRRNDRHTDTGLVVMGLSAVDNALWDVCGKLANQPVFRLLGGKRERLPAYLSIQPDEDISKARQQARQLYAQGNTAQKWFFRWGPPDGEKGFAKIVGLVEGLRTDLGPNARLMFDFSVRYRNEKDWDVPYAIRVAKAIEPFAPTWLEEPFPPEEIDSYKQLKDATNIPLATGEHTYSRWNIQPFLDANLIHYVQSDPEWCGGISELLQIGQMVKGYKNVQLIPHGHHVLAAAHVVAAHSPELCPLVEHGLGWLPFRQEPQTRILSVQSGTLTTPTEPGLGPDIDWKRFERV